jgi:hypothetical protein
MGAISLPPPAQRKAAPERANPQQQNAIQQNPTPPLPPNLQADLDRIARAIETANVRPDTAAEEQLAKDNLQAQREMAMWAGRMFYVVVFEAAVILLGVILVGFTLAATRQAVREAKRSADESKRQADIAEKTFVSLERPFATT